MLYLGHIDLSDRRIEIMDAKLTIDEKLKDLRLERKLTLEELANETGLSSSAPINPIM